MSARIKCGGSFRNSHLTRFGSGNPSGFGLFLRAGKRNFHLLPPVDFHLWFLPPLTCSWKCADSFPKSHLTLSGSRHPSGFGDLHAGKRNFHLLPPTDFHLWFHLPWRERERERERERRWRREQWWWLWWELFSGSCAPRSASLQRRSEWRWTRERKRDIVAEGRERERETNFHYFFSDYSLSLI